MRFRLKPTDASFYGLFTTQAEHLVRGSTLLATVLEPGADHAAIAKAMADAEHAADETTHEIVRRVNTTSGTPFDREDVYRLASALDDVMDYMEEAVDLIAIYQVGELPGMFATQVEVLMRASEVTAEAMPRLRTMTDLEEYWIEINRLENQGDRNNRRIMAHLFSGEYRSLDVLKLKDVASSLESAVDALESVAHTVEQIAVKQS